MKKKLTVNTLAFGNLKQRRKQYTIMIIGIILAMVFTSSALFFMKSANDTHLEARSHEYGGQDFIVSIQGYQSKDYDKLVKDGVATECGIAHIQGFAYNNDENNGFCVGWLDDKATTLSKQTLIEGEMPENENEIAVEKSVPLYLGMKDAGLGDTIKLNVSIPNGADYSKAKQKEYKIVGILEDKYSNLTFDCVEKEYQKVVPAIYVAQNSLVEIGGKENYSAYCMINNAYVKAYLKSLNNSRDYGKSDALCDYFNGLDKEYVINAFNYGGFGFLDFDEISENGGYAFTLILILVFASCVIIANAFNTNLKDRKKQIGMLRAVGTTKRQVFKIFGREAFLISIIATPISIAVSYALVRIMLKLTSDTAIMNNSVWVLFVCAVVNVAVVMLSALIPLARASKIAPIQAIRNINNNRKIKTKKIKTQKEFVPSKHLAKRNLTFYKGSRTAVIVMLVITIVGTSFGASFVSYVKDNLRNFYYDYAIVEMPDSMTEHDKQSIESLPYVESVYGKKESNSVQIEINNVDSYIAALYPESFMDPEHWNESKDRIKNCTYNQWEIEHLDEQRQMFGMKGDPFSTELYGYDERQIATLEDKLLDGKIDYDKLASGEEVILVAPNRVQYKVKKEGHGAYASFNKYDDEVVSTNIAYKTFADEKRTINAGDEFRISFANVNYDDDGNIVSIDNPELKTIKIGAIVSPTAVSSNYGFGIYDFAMITSLQGFNGFCPGVNYREVGINVNCELDDDKDFSIVEDLKDYRAKCGGAWLDNNYQYTKRQQNDLSAFLTTMYAIAILCFALCISIINNSMSAQIRENKRVIGTLRAVGADEKELVMSYFNQMISTLGLGVGIGYGIFIALFFGIKFLCYATGAHFGFTFNPILSLCMIVPLIIVCTLNLWSKIHKEMKNSIVENIREL